MDDLQIVRPESADQIAIAYFRLLSSVDQYGAELLPTLENAQYLTTTIFEPAWRRGEPILFAVVRNEIIGATFTVLPPEGLQFRVPQAFGHGTWVREDWRKKGVATALLKAVREQLLARGVLRQIGQANVSNAASLASFSKLGFVPFATVLSFDL